MDPRTLASKKQWRRALLAIVPALLAPGCLGVGVYAEVNGGAMVAEIDRRAEGSTQPTRTWVTTFGLSVGADFEFAATSYLALGYTNQSATLRTNNKGVTLGALDLTAMSSVPALRSRTLIPRVVLAGLWNNDEAETRGAMAGLGLSWLGGPNTMLTGSANATYTRWNMDGDSYRGAGGLGRLRLTYTFDRKRRSR